jgi:hypothetical protein
MERAETMSDIFFSGHGDVARLVEVFAFLMTSADYSRRSITLDELAKALPDAHNSVTNALAEDGHESEDDRLALSILHMVFGRVERDIVVAHLGVGKFSQSSIEYIIEGRDLLGRRYRFADPDVAFLEHEIRTGDSAPVYVVGNTPVLGKWDPERALPRVSYSLTLFTALSE